MNLCLMVNPGFILASIFVAANCFESVEIYVEEQAVMYGMVAEI